MMQKNTGFMKNIFSNLKKHNGTFITYDDSPDVLEGLKLYLGE